MPTKTNSHVFLLGCLAMQFSWPVVADPGPPLAMTAASRTSGTAPLSVHFDALNPVSGIVQASGVEYLDYDYQWSFGDPGAGAWATSAQSRNQASGFVAAHVYEQPGTYNATLTVRTTGGSVHHYQQTITVDDGPGWTNYYVSSSMGSDSNPGTSPAQPFASFAHAMSHSAPNTRILFRRGDTFTQVNGVTIGGGGPRLVGAYGDGSKPIIQTTGTEEASSSVFRFAFAGLSGWRFVDLDLRGNPASTDNAAFWGIGVVSPPDDLLLLNLNVSSFRSTGIVILRNECDTDHLFIVNTRIRNIPRSWAAFVGSNRLALLGNDMEKEDESGSHTLRVPCTRRGVIAHNHLASAWHSTVKLHGEIYNGPGTETEDIVISDNWFHGSNWQVNLGPTDAGRNETVRRILYERNLHTTVDRTGVMLNLWSRDVLVRNNVFIAGPERSGETWAIHIRRLGVEPHPERNRILHNTFFNGSSSGYSAVVLGLSNATAPVAGTQVRNNLIARAGGGWLRMLFDYGVGTGTVDSHNIEDHNGLFENPAGRNFRLLEQSPGIDAGIPVGVRYDFDGRLRDALPDAGAFEHETGGVIFSSRFESGPIAAAPAREPEVTPRDNLELVK